MAKKRLNTIHRNLIIDWMIEEKINKNEGREEILSQFEKVFSLINPILRNKYPEEDMIILRKYKLNRIDSCLKFNLFNENGSIVFGINIYKYHNLYQDYYDEIKDKLIDIPSSGGCRNDIVFEGTEELRVSINTLDTLIENYKESNYQKEKKYRSFINTCKYLEEIEEVLTLPENIITKIRGISTALTIMNPELINSIKEDFKCQ